jgi:beta-galactosidase
VVNFSFAYGGAFGETQSDSFLCVSGIMTSNKTPKPSAKVVSTVFNWFETKAIDINNGQFEIYNYHKFIKDTAFNYFWNISENGDIIKEGKIANFHLLPGAHKLVKIDYGPFDRKPGKEYTINITINKTSKFKGMF